MILIGFQPGETRGDGAVQPEGAQGSHRLGGGGRRRAARGRAGCISRLRLPAVKDDERIMDYFGPLSRYLYIKYRIVCLRHHFRLFK